MDWRRVPEDAPLAPLSSYAASKVAQENYVSAWARQVGGRAVVLRYHNVYGPWMPADSPYSGVAAIFRSALERGEPPHVFEDGRQARDFVHVQDVARANSLAVGLVTRSRAVGESVAYNICSGHAISVGEVATILTDAAAPGSRPVVTGEWRPGDVRHIVASPERAAGELLFEATIRPEDGLRAFVDEPLRDR
jgi:dTDP-L-rhamnose 4-epimerase